MTGDELAPGDGDHHRHRGQRPTADRRRRVHLGGGGVLPPAATGAACGTPCGVIFGDPHLLSFDKAPYDAQAVGELIAAKSTTGRLRGAGPPPPCLGVAPSRSTPPWRCGAAGHRVTMYRTLTGLDTLPRRQPADRAGVPASSRAAAASARTASTTPSSSSGPTVRGRSSAPVGVFPSTGHRRASGSPASPGTRGRGSATPTAPPASSPLGGVPVTYPNTPFAELSARTSTAGGSATPSRCSTTGRADHRDVHRPDLTRRPGDTADPAGRGPRHRHRHCNLFGLATPATARRLHRRSGPPATPTSPAPPLTPTERTRHSDHGTTSLGAATTIVTTAPERTRCAPSPVPQVRTLTISANSFSGGADFTVRARMVPTVTSIYRRRPGSATCHVAGDRHVYRRGRSRDQQTGTATHARRSAGQHRDDVDRYGDDGDHDGHRGERGTDLRGDGWAEATLTVSANSTAVGGLLRPRRMVRR